MTQNKTPRSTPGSDADPSDAFLDALTERAAVDSQANLAAGGRVVETVLNDPIVRAELDRVDRESSSRCSELKVAATKAIETNDALLREPSMDDNAYWAPGAAPKEILMKHQMSGAEDAHSRWTVDEATKTITIEQETHMGKPFISTSLLTDLVLVVMHREGLIAYNDDTKKSWTPVRTDYTVFVRLGTLRLRAEVWQQMPHAGAPQSTIELYPVAEA